MSFQLTRTHTTVVLAATTIAASLVVIPSLAEGNHATEDPFCASLTGADARITAEYNPLLAQYADAAAGNSAGNKADPEREAQLRKDLADAQAALEVAKQDAEKPSPSVSDAPAVGDAPAADTTVDRGLDWVDWSKVDYETQAKIIEALIVQKMNAYRANVGLPELVVSDTVTGDARSWSKHMSDTDSFEHDQSYKNMGQGALDGADTMSAAENIAYNHLENFSAGGGMKTPAQAAADLFDQWKNSKGHDRNMLGASNTVGVGVYIAKGSEGTRVYGTQKFYGVTGGSPNLSRFHTTGDTASAYGFDGKAFNTDNTNYVSGLAGSGDEQRANSWEKMVGALPGSALPVDVSTLPAKNGAAAPATPAPAPATPAPVDDKPSIDADKAVADAQAAVDAAQKALDDYLASISEDKPAVDLEKLDAQLDKVADSIAADTSVRPEKDGGVTVLEGDNKAERYLTAEEYRAALTNCTAAEIPNPSIGEPSAPAPGPSTPTTTAPVVPAPAPSQPSTPSKTRPQTIASTGTTATWVAVGAVAVLVAGIGALIASRRAKN
ncbi:CAP domain-containing protein [uncultured Actinomyces sp.]|uniref:CAP domain-containing protein n=1 Tax=uncultured Actinomyces sp. TaxID=249061 RepID=UPI0028E5C62F|nr:CAP domain-containing protein [uncultured Actinomyces sp.]